jgi:nucleoside-diphosphate-sugar epimerase
MKTVGIIGGSGYIGSHITKKFLEEGHRVRVGTTDLTKTEKYQHLMRLPNADRLEVVQLDLEKKNELGPFLQDCNIVVHGGTPFQLEVADPQRDLFDPTIKGTENFLEAIQHVPTIEKVVIIASVAAYNTDFPMLPGGKVAGDQVSEKDAPYMSKESHPYAQAKFIANGTVSKFISDNPKLHFEITSVSPVGVMGPALSQRADSTSMGVQHLFKNWIAPNPFIQMFYDNDIEWAIVDVADVAEGVYKAAITKGLHGRNYLLSAESYHVSDVHALLNGKDAVKEPRVVYDAALAQQELGITFRPARETLERYGQG